MRLIDADYLKTWFGEKDLYTYDYIVGTINDAPTIEPEKKRGKWIEIKHTFFHKCSQCSWLNDFDSGFDFCPNCGADMREGDAT